MATTTLPRRKKLSGRWIAVGIVLIVVAIGAALFINGRGQTATATGQSTVPVTRQNLTAMIAGSGSVTAEQSLNLPFQMSGTVTEVLVKEGDTVQVGQELVKLDDRNLQLQVASARASLESAKARLAQAQQGNAKAEDIAAVQAQLASAQANYDKTANGPSAVRIVLGGFAEGPSKRAAGPGQIRSGCEQSRHRPAAGSALVADRDDRVSAGQGEL
jgi:multidrug efflux pump subunit AcrA (membrane-fusion protein)